MLHLDVSAYKSPVYAIPGGAQFTKIFFVFFGFFRNRFVCFGCFDTCSKHRKKPKDKFFDFTKQKRKTTETDCVSVLFGQTENIFVCFEDTLLEQS
jgi:hypothetical protein